MAQETETKEVTAPEGTVSQTPEEDAWMAGMEGKYPEHKGDREAMFKASREGYDKEHELNKQNAEDYGKIYNAIQRSPETAGFINRLTHPQEGEEPEEAYAEFGEDLVDLLTGKIDNKAYREKKAANRAAADEAKAKEDSMKQAAGEAFVAACEEIGLSPEDAEKKLVEKFKSEDGDFRMSKDFYAALLKTLSYDDDIAAAEARGRNASLAERNNRRSVGTDGLPRTQGTGGATNTKKSSLAAIMEREKRMAQ